MLPSCWHDDLYQLLQNAGIPVVMLDQIPASMRHFPVDCVISDNYRGGALLAEHLLEKGHTKVWIMEQYLDSYTIEQRIQGFVDVYQKNGIDLLKRAGFFSPLFLLVPLQKRSSKATCISRSLLILPIPLLLFFLTAISPQWVV